MAAIEQPYFILINNLISCTISTDEKRIAPVGGSSDIYCIRRDYICVAIEYLRH